MQNSSFFYFSNRVTDYSPSLFGSNFPGITEIDFMMHALIRNVEDVALALHVFVHVQ